MSHLHCPKAASGNLDTEYPGLQGQAAIGFEQMGENVTEK